jgi:hypothetical protein
LIGTRSESSGRLNFQTSVKGPFRFQNIRRLNCWKVGAGGQPGR